MSKKAKDNIIGTVVWSDGHAPFMCMPSHNAIYAFCKDKKPTNHVHIGDCLDLAGISAYVKEDLQAQTDNVIEDALIQLGTHFNKLFKITPKSNIYWIKGNHDLRLQTFVRKNPSWKGLLDNPLRLLKAFGGCDTSRIKYIELDDFEDDFKIGKMHFCHGFYHCKHTAAKHVEAYGESVCFGHVHTMQMFTAVRRTKPIAGYTVGHLMTKEARKYLKGRPTRWVKGFGYMEHIESSGQYTFHLLPIIDGSFIFNGKVYRGSI